MGGTGFANKGAHETAIRPADMAVEHIQVALVGRQIHRFARPRRRNGAAMGSYGAAAQDRRNRHMWHSGGRGPDPARKGGPQEGAEYRGVTADLHRVGRIAGMLMKDPGRAGGDGLTAKTGGEPDPLAVHIAAGIAEDVEDLRVVAKLHASLAGGCDRHFARSRITPLR